MEKDIVERLRKLEQVKVFAWIWWVTGITEEILKRRRRTTLAIGGIISLAVFWLK